MQPQRFPCRTDPRFVGDPVDVVADANTDVAVDFRLSGPLWLHWRRYYHSGRSATPGPFGWGHSHEFDRALCRDLDGLHYTDPFGAVVEFPPLEEQEWAVRDGFLLRRVTWAGYELEQAGEPVMEFTFTGRADAAPLRRLRQGEAQIEFRHEPGGRLREIVDSRGRVLAVDSDDRGRGRGVYLTDPAGQGRRIPGCNSIHPTLCRIPPGLCIRHLRPKPGLLARWTPRTSCRARSSNPAP